MANRYWVGGSGTWDSSSTTNWSATSGGAAGASAPTSVDVAIFDANSGSPDVFISGGVCSNWTHSAGIANFTNFGIDVYGSITWSAGTTIVSNAFGIYLSATSGSFSLNFAGKQIPGGLIQFGPSAPSTATWTLQNTIVCDPLYSLILSFVGGTFTTFNGTTSFAISGPITIQTSPGASNHTINLNGSTIGTAAVPINQFLINSDGGGTYTTTVNLGTSTVNCAYTIFNDATVSLGTPKLTVTSSAGQSFSGGTNANATFFVTSGSTSAFKALTGMGYVGLVSYSGTMSLTTISMNAGGSSGLVEIGGNGSFGNTVAITSIASTNTAFLEVRVKQNFTCSSTITLPDDYRSEINSSGSDIDVAVTITGATVANKISLSDTGTGTFTFTGAVSHPTGYDGQIELDRTGGNTVFGAVNSNDIYIFDGNNYTFGTITSTNARTLSQASFTTQTLTPPGAVVVGSFAVGSGATRWEVNVNGCSSFQCGAMAAIDVLIKSTGAVTLTGTLTIANDAVTVSDGYQLYIECASGSATALTMASNVLPKQSNIISSGTFTVSGAISAPDNNFFVFSGAPFNLGTSLTCVGFQISDGSSFNFGTCAITLGNTTVADDYGYLIIGGNVTVSTGANTLTITRGTAPNQIPDFIFYVGSNVTLSNITVSAPVEQLSFYTYAVLSATLTCNNFTRTGPTTRQGSVRLSDVDLTANGTLNLSGNSLINRLFVFCDDDSSTQTITAATRTLANVDFRGITAAGGVLPWALGTSVGDAQGNSNITFTTPTTRFAVASGDWESTSVWSATSGGAAGASIPLPQDDVQFNSGSGAITVNSGERRFLGNTIYLSNFTGTLNINPTIFSYTAILGDFLVTSGNVTGASGLSNQIILMKKTPIQVDYYPSNTSTDVSILMRSDTSCSFDLGGNTIGRLFSLAGSLSLSSSSATITAVTSGSVGFEAWPDVSGIASILYLGSSSFTCNNMVVSGSARTVDGGTSTVTLNNTSTSGTTYTFGNNVASFLNNIVVNSVTATSALPNVGLNGKIAGTLTTTGAGPYNISGSITLLTNAKFTPGSYSLPISATSLFITDNSTSQQETSFVYYRSCSVTGTGLGIRAFGASNLGNNGIGITFPSPIKIAAFSNYAGSWTIPNDFGGSFYVVAVGGGGQGRWSTFGGSGGAGSGGVSITYGIPALRNQTIYVNAAASTGKRTINSGTSSSGAISWINLLSNSNPTLLTQGARAAGGNGVSGTFGGSGASTLSGVGSIRLSGASGGNALGDSGGGGGAGVAAVSFGFSSGGAGGGGTNLPGGGGGGGGTLGFGFSATSGVAGTSTGNGGTGGGPAGGAGGTSGVAGSTSLTGGGGGGSGARVRTATGTLTRTAGTTTATCTFSTPQTGLIAAGSLYRTSLSFTNVTGTYSRSGTTVTANYTNHGLTVGQSFYFRTITGLVSTATYTVATTPTANQFTFTTGTSGSTSGSFSLGVDVSTSSNPVTALDDSTFTITTTSSTYKPSGNFSITYVSNTPNATSGGNGGDNGAFSYSYFNGVSSTGTVGYGGGGGGSGSGNYVTSTSGVDPGDGGYGAGGGSAGRAVTTATGGAGGAGLVLFVYAIGIEDASSQIIG